MLQGELSWDGGRKNGWESVDSAVTVVERRLVEQQAFELTTLCDLVLLLHPLTAEGSGGKDWGPGAAAAAVPQVLLTTVQVLVLTLGLCLLGGDASGDASQMKVVLSFLPTCCCCCSSWRTVLGTSSKIEMSSLVTAEKTPKMNVTLVR